MAQPFFPAKPEYQDSRGCGNVPVERARAANPSIVLGQENPAARAPRHNCLAYEAGYLRSVTCSPESFPRCDCLDAEFWLGL